MTDFLHFSIFIFSSAFMAPFKCKVNLLINPNVDNVIEPTIASAMHCTEDTLKKKTVKTKLCYTNAF